MGSPMFFGAAHASSLGFELILLVVERTGRNGGRQNRGAEFWKQQATARLHHARREKAKGPGLILKGQLLVPPPPRIGFDALRFQIGLRFAPSTRPGARSASPHDRGQDKATSAQAPTVGIDPRATCTSEGYRLDARPRNEAGGTNSMAIPARLSGGTPRGPRPERRRDDPRPRFLLQPLRPSRPEF